jgi:hypothetical protein
MYCSQRCTKRWGKCPLLTPVLRNYTLVVHTPTSHISPPAVAARDLHTPCGQATGSTVSGFCRPFFARALQVAVREMAG